MPRIRLDKSGGTWKNVPLRRSSCAEGPVALEQTVPNRNELYHLRLPYPILSSSTLKQQTKRVALRYRFVEVNFLWSVHF